MSLLDTMMKLGNPPGPDEFKDRKPQKLRMRTWDDQVPVQNINQEFINLKDPNQVIPPELEKSLHGMPDDIIHQFGFRRVNRHPNNPWAPKVNPTPQGQPGGSELIDAIMKAQANG
jgi:hypothetical protein